jgi:ribosomal protein L37AE/L43A
MRFRPYFAALTFVAACMFTGCVQPQPAPVQPDPFGFPQCQPGCCPDHCPPGCPPGCCPQQRGYFDGDTHGVEVGAGGSGYPVNSLAQNETKSGVTVDGDSEEKNGICLPCQPAVPYHQPQSHQLAAQPPRLVSPANEVKQGTFRCEKCQRPTVGRDWQEIWADDGTSLMCMCKECYRTSTPLQREVVLRNFLSRTGIDPKKRPSIEAAVREASRGY